jgi:hypothetical protein
MKIAEQATRLFQMGDGRIAEIDPKQNTLPD